MKNTNVLYLFIILLGLGCKTPKYTHFSLRNSVWKNTGQLKTDGYYYTSKNPIKENNGMHHPPYRVFLFWSNGLSCKLAQLFDSHEDIHNFLKAHKNNLGVKDKFAYWGRYRIQDEEIFIEYFFYNPDKFHLGVYRCFGTLCTDECFTIKERFMVKDDPVRTDLDHYKYDFMPLSEKVDSTNWMMKKRWYKNP